MCKALIEQLLNPGEREFVTSMTGSTRKVQSLRLGRRSLNYCISQEMSQITTGRIPPRCIHNTMKIVNRP